MTLTRIYLIRAIATAGFLVALIAIYAVIYAVMHFISYGSLSL